MAGLALALAAAAPLVLAADDERSWLHVPSVGDVRVQAIAREDNEKDWPFAAEQGYLACLYVTGQRQVYFVSKEAENGEGPAAPRVVAISSDPFVLSFANFGKNAFFAPHAGLGDLLRRVAPFVQTGARLCDQPRGAKVGSGEL